MCVGSRFVGRSQKRWINSVSNWFKKKIWMFGKQRMVNDRNECRGLLGECMWHTLGNEPLTTTGCQSCRLLHLYKTLVGWRFFCDQTYNLGDIMKNCLFSLVTASLLLLFFFNGMMLANPEVVGYVCLYIYYYYYYYESI